jgi:hypothetical protein
VRYVPANNSTFSPFSPQRIARKLLNTSTPTSVNYFNWYAHLFLAVSTALTIKAPFVPGSFTYSNFGGGIGGIGDVAVTLFELSISTVFGMGEEGRSSDLRPWKAFVIKRGIKREDIAEREDKADGVVSGSAGTAGVDGAIQIDSGGEVDGRTVDARDRLDRSECDRVPRVVGRSPTTGVDAVRD